MARFDRYMLSQLMVLFGFFALVLVAVFWINNAVRLFDRLIADGQSAWIFLQFTMLSLPNVIRTILPIAAFSGAVYVTNRFSNDSEMVVMQATGFSPWRLARPVVFFGILVGLMLSVMTHFLVPLSLFQLREKEQAVARNVTARLLTEGTFLHPAPGVTFYIRQIDPDGTLNDVFLSDRRNPEEPQTFTASRAYLINTADDAATDEPRPRLVMVDGLAQSLNSVADTLYTTHFEDFAYDISGLVGAASEQREFIRHLSTGDLLHDPADVVERTGDTYGRVMEEAHGRFQQALMCVVAALIGFATLIAGGFSRFGVWRQIVLAILLLVLVKIVESVVGDPVRRNGDLWPLLYVPILVGLVIPAGLLAWAARVRRVPTRDFGDDIGADPNAGTGVGVA